MNKARAICVVSLFWLAGCPPTLLPDPLASHRLAREECLKVLVERAPKQFKPMKVCYPAGSVIATPEAIRAALPE